MGKRDPRVDAYIERSADFAKPILTHLRNIVHAGCPKAEETLMRSFPHFMDEGMLCGMAVFEKHRTFGFWKGSLISARARPAKVEESALGQFDRVTSVSQLPARRVNRVRQEGRCAE